MKERLNFTKKDRDVTARQVPDQATVNIFSLCTITNNHHQPPPANSSSYLILSYFPLSCLIFLLPISTLQLHLTSLCLDLLYFSYFPFLLLRLSLSDSMFLFFYFSLPCSFLLCHPIFYVSLLYDSQDLILCCQMYEYFFLCVCVCTFPHFIAVLYNIYLGFVQ